MALAMGAALALPCAAQKAHTGSATQAHPANKPAQPPRSQRPADRPPHTANPNANRPPNGNNGSAMSMNSNSNRPPNAAVHPRDLTPQQRENLPKLNKLSPQEKQEMRDRARVWDNLTPKQRLHIKSDVMPKWQQMPRDRQRAIRQRLGVLQNMPESARNQHLNDPNFTRGMSEEDKAMLRDLSHMHVGGAPEPPSE